MNQSLPNLTVVLLLAGLACSTLHTGNPLTWHVLLEVDAVPDKAAAVPQTVGILRNRLNAVGVPNFEVLAQGSPPNGQILVRLADVPDRERLTRLITSGGKLEFAPVISPSSPSPLQSYNTREEAVAALGANVPSTRRVLPYVERNDSTAGDQRPQRWVVVEAPAIVDGSELRDATAVPSRSGDSSYEIAFSLKPSGAQKFGDWTGSHVNHYLAVVLNGEVKSVAFIKSQIFDQGEITGRFTKESAEDLALVLRSGALPAPVKIIAAGDDK